MSEPVRFDFTQPKSGLLIGVFGAGDGELYVKTRLLGRWMLVALMKAGTFDPPVAVRAGRQYRIEGERKDKP